MSTTVCQRVQSQFDPWRVESRGIQFKFTQPSPTFSLPSKRSPTPPLTEVPVVIQNVVVEQKDARKSEVCSEDNMKSSTKEGDMGGWSFLQALANTTPNSQNDSAKVYVHPLAKRTALALSEKSLEMCTESLGSETGSIVSESGDDLISSFSLSEIEKTPRIPCYTAKKRSTNVANFPPPLTTIRSGTSCGVQVKSVREDGRLVIKAVSVGTPKSCFEAERSDGRLRLRYFDDSSSSSVSSNDNEFHDESSQDIVQANDQDDGHVHENADCEYDTDYDEEMDPQDEDVAHDSKNVREEIEVDDFRRPRRCNEEGNGRRKDLLNYWEPFWVTTS